MMSHTHVTHVTHTPRTSARAQVVTSHSSLQPLPINDGGAIEFESDLFVGRLQLFAKGLPNTPAGMFDGRRRLTWVGLQGRFKRRLQLAEVVTGQVSRISAI